MESREQRKQRLKAAGQWDRFVELRAELEREGMTPAKAAAEAERRIGAEPGRSTTPTSDPPKAPGVLLPAETAPEGMPQDLFDAQQVMERDDSAGDRGGRQRFYRRLKENDPFKFADLLRRMERDYHATQASELEDETDEGTERCVALVEKLLADINRDTEKATSCPSNR